MLWLRFGHFLGMSLWIGGALAAMVVAGALKNPASPNRGAAAFFLSRLHGYLVGPGAMLTTATGLLLTMTLTSRGLSDLLVRPGMVIMQGAGIVAAVLAIFAGVPTANQLATLLAAAPDGDLTPLARQLQKRQAVVSSIAGTLALIALFFGVVLR